jgi:uncharacterized protein DUF4431
MTALQKTILFALFTTIAYSCNNKASDKRAETDTTTNKTVANNTIPDQQEPVQQENYKYDPAVSILYGTIDTEGFEGPSGNKENVFILTVEKPIDVISETTDPDDPNITRRNVIKIQLIPGENIQLNDRLHKKVKLTGVLFGAHTGHHFTDVLLGVKQLDLL